MKRFLSAVGLCSFVLAASLFFLSPASTAQKKIQPASSVLDGLLALPAPPPPNPLVKLTGRAHAEEFYDKAHPPTDDAPIEDLFDYWTFQSARYNKFAYNAKPSPKAAERLLKECEDNPEKLPRILNSLPDSEQIAEQVKNFYDSHANDDDLDENWQDSVEHWLTYHSKYFTGELVQKARNTRDENGYIVNQDEVVALAKVDWSTAQPILDEMMTRMGQPVTNMLAKWAYYQHALREGDQADIDRYRGELKAAVEDKDLAPQARDMAFDALVKSGDWEGRDDWYMKLMEDESLFDLRSPGHNFTGLTTIVAESEPGKSTERMIRLMNSDNKTVREAAIRNLTVSLDVSHPEIVKALLDWLQNPEWAKEARTERRQLVTLLTRIKMPESIPGLIAALNEKYEASERPASVDYGTNSARFLASPTGNFRIGGASSGYAANAAMNAANAAMYAANAAMNAATTTTSAVRTSPSSPTKNSGPPKKEYVYPLRDEAVSALGFQGGPRAVPALRALLLEVDGYSRVRVVSSVLECKGFSVAEQVAGLEEYAAAVRKAREEAAKDPRPVGGADGEGGDAQFALSDHVPYGFYDRMTEGGATVSLLLGAQMAQPIDAEEELVAATMGRIQFYERSDPPMAVELQNILEAWKGAAIDALALKALKNGSIKLDKLLDLLARRKDLREKQPMFIAELRDGVPLARGVMPCFLESDAEYEGALSNENKEVRTAMLGCARIIRAPLPLEKVAQNLKDQDARLGSAAEQYLESEDSPAARAIVLANHPNTARILGSRIAFEYENAQTTSNVQLRQVFCSVNDVFCFFPGDLASREDDTVRTEKKLKKELDEDKSLQGFYSYDSNFIRIYGDRAVFSWEEDPYRYRERTLSAEEFENFRNYVGGENLDAQPAFIGGCSYCLNTEFLMFGRAGGRRIYFHGKDTSKLQTDLDSIFTEMRKPPAKLHYWLEKSIPGLEILYDSEEQPAWTVWKNGNDLRIVVENTRLRKQIDKDIKRAERKDYTAEIDYDKIRTIRQKRRDARKYEEFTWFHLNDGQLADKTDQPLSVEYIPLKDNPDFPQTEEQWKTRAAGISVRDNDGGLFKIAGSKAVKIVDGNYSMGAVTANGRWAIAKKFSDEDESRESIVRVNLLTDREFKVATPDAGSVEAESYIPSLNKVLLLAGDYDSGIEGVDPKTGQFYLLDPETGAIQKPFGEVRPLYDQSFRPLQSFAEPDIFWAAIADSDKEETRVGLYNMRTLTFRPLITIPKMEFNSMDMWVDQTEGKLYFTYSGHLLRLPLPAVPAN